MQEPGAKDQKEVPIGKLALFKQELAVQVGTNEYLGADVVTARWRQRMNCCGHSTQWLERLRLMTKSQVERGQQGGHQGKERVV